jgi:hypothetical protein
MKIQPSRNSRSMSAWEIRDNRNKLVGKFDTNKITNLQARQEYDKLKALAEIKNIKNDLLSVKDRIKDLFLKNDEWQVCDRAMKALSQTKDTITELEEIIDHIKQS